MSLVQRLRPHLEELKVHKSPLMQTGTERRLSQMVAIITNTQMSKATKDKLLREIVDESRVEKALKARGVKL